MAITKYDITTTWQAISADGESGIAWIPQQSRVGFGKVLVYHTDGTAPTGTEKMEESYLLDPTPESTPPSEVTLTADNASDQFYARTVSGIQDLNVDVV